VPSERSVTGENRPHEGGKKRNERNGREFYRKKGEKAAAVYGKAKRPNLGWEEECNGSAQVNLRDGGSLTGTRR